MPVTYIWFFWSSLLLVFWGVVYLLYPEGRKRMLKASLLTAPFGLTEPIFVPEYWNPPSLFDLAQKTGFDIESLIFCFGIGGLGIVLYDFIFKVRHVEMSPEERQQHRHKYHVWTLLSPILTFPILYLFTDWNPIYSATVAMFVGGLAALWCRPDLKIKIWISGVMFLIFYVIYFITLELGFPGYVERVWTLANISGIMIWRIPLEELIFAFTFGMLWSSYYEHLKWRKIVH